MEAITFKEQTWAGLKNRLMTDDEFKSNIQSILYFYQRKILAHAKNAEQKEFVTERFEDVVFSQFFQGYLIMSAMLKDEDVELDSSLWSSKKGQLRNAIPTLINEMFAVENRDWQYTEVGHEFGIQVLDVLSSAYELVKNARTEITYYGAYNAVIEDERFDKSRQEFEELRLGPLEDLEFISPQVYMVGQYTTDSTEVWDMFAWSAVSEGNWLGTIHFTDLKSEEFPSYLLEINVQNSISKEEQVELRNSIIEKLPTSIQELMQTRVYRTNEMEILVPQQKKEQVQATASLDEVIPSKKEEVLTH